MPPTILFRNDDDNDFRRYSVRKQAFHAPFLDNKFTDGFLTRLAGLRAGPSTMIRGIDGLPRPAKGVALALNPVPHKLPSTSASFEKVGAEGERPWKSSMSSSNRAGKAICLASGSKPPARIWGTKPGFYYSRIIFARERKGERDERAMVGARSCPSDVPKKLSGMHGYGSMQSTAGPAKANSQVNH